MPDITELFSDNPDYTQIARTVANDAMLFDGMLAGIDETNKNLKLREHCNKTILAILETDSKSLLRVWKMLPKWTKSENAYLQMIGMKLIAGLASTISESEMETMLEVYLAMLEDESVMLVSHCALNATQIIKAFPKYEPRITERMLSIEEICNRPNQLELIKSYIVDAFDAYFDLSGSKEKIVGFVERLEQSPSPKARKQAQKFLRKHR